MPNETRQVRYGYAEQVAFATPIAVDQAFNEVTVDPFDMDADVMIHELPSQHGTHQPVEQNTAHSVKGSSTSFSVAGPVDLRDIDQFAYAHFQKVVEQSDTEYTKTFTYFTSHPDFASDEGHFLTWIKRFPLASSSQHVGGCIAKRFKLSAERDGMLMFETEWQGLGTCTETANPSGTWTPSDGSDFVYFNDIVSATLSHGAGLTSPVAIKMASFEVEGVHEFDKVGHDATAGFESMGLHTRSGSFKVKILRDTVTQEAIASMKVGELVQLSIDIGTIVITINGKVEANDYESEGLLMSTLACRMLSAYSSSAVGESFTLVIQNTLDRGWPAA